jgi:hypothetical protein
LWSASTLSIPSRTRCNVWPREWVFGIQASVLSCRSQGQHSVRKWFMPVFSSMASSVTTSSSIRLTKTRAMEYSLARWRRLRTK